MYRTNHEYSQEKVYVIQQQKQFDIKTIDGTDLKRVKEFKYLGAWVNSSEKDVKIRRKNQENLPPDEKYLVFKTQ